MFFVRNPMDLSINIFCTCSIFIFPNRDLHPMTCIGHGTGHSGSYELAFIGGLVDKTCSNCVGFGPSLALLFQKLCFAIVKIEVTKDIL